MKTVIVIPARKASTRFPNKPMAPILGVPLLERVWRIAKAVKNVDGVWIATDDSGIENLAKSFGANVVMTRPDCENGTERVYDAVQKLDCLPEIVLNLQGDAVLTPPFVLQAVLDEMQSNPEIQLATPATQMSWAQYDEFMISRASGKAGGTLVVFDLKKNALYFSKGAIPFIRDRGNILESVPPIHRHIGLYCYRYPTLKKYLSLSQTPLEKVEKLEQLRALEHGIPIRIVPVDYQGRTHGSVDNPEDIQKVEQIILKEGELV